MSHGGDATSATKLSDTVLVPSKKLLLIDADVFVIPSYTKLNADDSLLSAKTIFSVASSVLIAKGD